METVAETCIEALDLAPKAQLKDGRNETMNKGIKYTHLNSLFDLMGIHQLQLDWERTSIGPN